MPVTILKGLSHGQCKILLHILTLLTYLVVFPCNVGEVDILAFYRCMCQYVYMRVSLCIYIVQTKVSVVSIISTVVLFFGI